jgi:tRNA-2-methylthio-N6-dimethylallyladenosine synthase
MNEYDSELVRTILRREAFSFANQPEDADVVLLNTCAIREHAYDVVYGRIGRLAPLRTQNPDLVIGVLGCMAQNLKDDLLGKNSGVDLIAGPDSYKRLPALIREVRASGASGMEVDLSEYETYSDIVPERVPGVNAWIAVMRGCDNFCTFCVVPYTRGRERSRTITSVVEETRELAGRGYKQVTLLGQNVNSYSSDGSDFADLLEAVAAVPGIERVRFTSPHPKDFPRRLLQAMARNPKICKHIHLPMQSGSDVVLDRMRRTYTRDEYLDLVEEIRGTIPGVSLSTDVIAGFPGESEEDFAATLTAMEQVEFDSAFIFKYSERRGTIAARKYPDDVSEAEKSTRVVRLNVLQKAAARRRNLAWVGRIIPVLLEGPSRKSAQDAFGRADGNQGVVFPWLATSRPGDIVPVEVISVSAHTLIGRIASPAPPRS